MDESSTSGINPAHIAGTDFIMLHLDLLDELDGDFHAALLLARIQFRAGTDGWWEADQERVQQDTRLSEHQLRRALKVLREAGYVETRRQSPYDPTLKYRVILAETPATTVTEESSITSPEESPSVNEDFTDTVTEDFTLTPSSKNIEEQKQEPPLPPKGGNVAMVDSSFDEFWKAYPRKDAKQPARKKWERLLKKHDAGMLIHAAVNYRQWCEREGKANELILLPTTWMNQERWNDERVNLPSQPLEKSRTQEWLELAQELWDNENGSQTSNPLQLEG